jgi:UDP-glucose:glycoprotein glucosyltransferase
MKSELKMIEALKSLSISTNDAIKLLSSTAATKNSDLGWGESFDVRDDSVIWWNDLQKDRRYQNWPKYITDVNSLNCIST